MQKFRKLPVPRRACLSGKSAHLSGSCQVHVKTGWRLCGILVIETERGTLKTKQPRSQNPARPDPGGGRTEG